MTQRNCALKKLKFLLITIKIETPRLYLLPKIHKCNNPGRPVLSSVDCHTSKISEFVDHYMHP